MSEHLNITDMGALAVYIHWPYCARICPYCDFNVYKGRQNVELVEAIISDLSYWRERSGPRTINSIHFGGGTPSLLPAKDLEHIILHVTELWGLNDGVEVALEANPNDASLDDFKGLESAGVNRLSLGVQSFHDDTLTLLGRDHNGTQAREALEGAMRIFPSVSLDMIFGWHGQTTALWNEDLDIAIKSGAPHISAYQLTIEEGTAFAKAEGRGQKKTVGEDASADFYDLTRSRLTGAEYAHYEVSNYAKSGHTSRHNKTYWQGGDYVGVGPGAHGRLTIGGARWETIATLAPKNYTRLVSETGRGLDFEEKLSPRAWAQEYVLMGLRISEGISRARFKAINGQDLSMDKIAVLTDAGLLTHSRDTVAATPEGRLVLNRLTQELLETLD